MSDKQFINFTVRCPGDPCRTEKVQIILTKLPDGSWFPLPCNGCDSLNGTKPCERCCAAITLMFFHAKEGEIDLSKPISPDFSLLKGQ